MPHACARRGGLMGFVHLRVHSAYSLSEGAIKLETLPRLAAEA
ncbi:MAG: hypothetical protein ACK4ST_13005, partial [Elioraea tepidiphila]